MGKGVTGTPRPPLAKPLTEGNLFKSEDNILKLRNSLALSSTLNVLKFL